jgi:hypothetical protein
LLVGSISCGVNEKVPEQSTEFASEVEDVLKSKIDLIRRTVTEDSRIIRSLEVMNEKNKNISMSEIKRLDALWMATGMEGEVKDFLNNEASNILMEFQDAHEGFPEIFVTDAKGLIASLTNKTSDYYQADEAWWVTTYNDGKGLISHGGIEYDESALAEAIAIYIPIFHPDTKEAIGVMKAIVDLTAIKMAL